MNFDGYKRPDGSFGIRNFLLIIPASKCVNRLAFLAAEELRKEYPEVYPLLHTNPCGLLKDDNERAFNTLSHIGINPNVGSVLVVGTGCDQLSPKEIAAVVEKSGRDVAWHTFDSSGNYDKAFKDTVDDGRKFIQKLKLMERVPVKLSELTLALKCGGSSALSGISCNPALGVATDKLIAEGGSAIFAEILENLGAEEIITARATEKKISDKIISMIQGMKDDIEKTGFDILGSQPTKGNIASGLSTIEEKALGAIMKSGTTPIVDALDYGKRRTKKGVNFLFTPDDTPELLLGMAAAGASVLAFTTGGGLPARLGRTPSMVGRFDILPIIRIVGNSEDYAASDNVFDIDAGTILEDKETIEGVGERIYEKILKVSSGEKVKAELMPKDYFEPLKIYSKGPLV